jgi:hypothetical protein
VEPAVPENAPIDRDAADREAAPSDVERPAEQPVDAVPGTVPFEVVGAEVIVPAHEKLGTEGVQRLRHRYSEILARIGERITDPVRRDELKATVERLNPDAWKTPDEVSAALEQYESVLASVLEVAGRRRRRRKRGGRSAESTGEEGGNAKNAPGAESSDDPDDSDPGASEGPV